MIINKKRSAAALLLTLLLGMTAVLSACGSAEAPDEGQAVEDSVAQYLIEDEGKTYISVEAVDTMYSLRSYLNDTEKVVVVRDEEGQKAMVFSPSSSLTHTGSVIIDEATGKVTDNQPWSYKVFDYLVYLPVEAVEKGLGKTDWEERLAYLLPEEIRNYFASITDSTFETEEMFMNLEKSYYGSDHSRLFTSLRNYENAKYVQYEGTIGGEYVDASLERNYMATEIREYTELYDEDFNRYIGTRIYIQGVTPSGSVVLTMEDGSPGDIDLDSDGFHPYNSVSRYGFDGIRKYWNLDIKRVGDTEEGYRIYKVSSIGGKETDIEIHLNGKTDSIVHITDTVEHNGKTLVRDLDIFY